LITIYLPSLDRLQRLTHPPRQLFLTQSSEFLSLRPKQHINLSWFLRWGQTLPQKLLTEVLTGLQKGFPTYYRGGGRFLQRLLFYLRRRRRGQGNREGERS